MVLMFQKTFSYIVSVRYVFLNGRVSCCHVLNYTACRQQGLPKD